MRQDALRHVFASRIAEIEDSPQWKRLSFVSCAYNGLVLMDDSLRLLPVVETLDLSRNKFAKVDNLGRCSKLKHLDLGFNQLRSITSFSKVRLYEILQLLCIYTKSLYTFMNRTPIHGQFICTIIIWYKSLYGLNCSSFWNVVIMYIYMFTVIPRSMNYQKPTISLVCNLHHSHGHLVSSLW